MSRLMPSWLAVALVLQLAGQGAEAAGATDHRAGRALSNEKAEAVREIVDGMMREHHIAGASIAIALDGDIVYAEGFGLADIGNSVEARPNTVYRTASIGKAMTAAAIMRLVERDVIDLNEEVQEYCPSFPRKEKGKITIHHLLSHQSGIRHYGGPNDYKEQHNTETYDNVVDPIAIFAGDPLLHPPGHEFTYSTFGYNLLGCAIVGALKVPFMKAMQELVFEPAGMTNTRDDDARAIIANRAEGYIFEDRSLKRAIQVDMSSKMPAGGFVSTAIDLAKFAIAMQSGKIVSRSTFETMISDKTLVDGRGTAFGYGWAVSAPGDHWYGNREVLHGGSTPGVSNMLYLLPQQQFAVAIMTNQQSFRGRVAYTGEIAKVVLDLGTESSEEPDP